MATELARQLRELIEDGAEPISFSEITDRAHAGLFAFRPGPAGSVVRHEPVRPALRPATARARMRPRWAAALAAGIVAVCCAGAITVTQFINTRFGGAGQPVRRAGVVLTGAQVRQMTAASQAALAHSARAYITYWGPSPYHAFQSEYVAFSGENYSFAGSVSNSAPGGRPGQVAWFAERLVNGQAYDHEFSSAGWRWFHYPGAAGLRAMRSLDPRTMLGVLAPSERFQYAGRVRDGGIRLERLRASDPAKVPGLGLLTGLGAGRYVTAIEVLVDRHGVVHRVNISLRDTTLVAAARSGKRAAGVAVRADSLLPGLAGYITMTVTFADFGQPQTITAPPHAIDATGVAGTRGRLLPTPVTVPQDGVARS